MVMREGVRPAIGKVPASRRAAVKSPASVSFNPHFNSITHQIRAGHFLLYLNVSVYMYVISHHRRPWNKTTCNYQFIDLNPPTYYSIQWAQPLYVYGYVFYNLRFPANDLMSLVLCCRLVRVKYSKAHFAIYNNFNSHTLTKAGRYSIMPVVVVLLLRWWYNGNLIQFATSSTTACLISRPSCRFRHICSYTFCF